MIYFSKIVGSSLFSPRFMIYVVIYVVMELLHFTSCRLIWAFILLLLLPCTVLFVILILRTANTINLMFKK
jgi:hypothetical protein